MQKSALSCPQAVGHMEFVFQIGLLLQIGIVLVESAAAYYVPTWVKIGVVYALNYINY